MKKCISDEWETQLSKCAQFAVVRNIFGEDGDGSAILDFGDISLRCDLPYFRCEGWEDMKTGQPNREIIGKRIRVVLYLLYLEQTNKKHSKKKRIEQIATEYIPAEYSTEYEIEGVVKEVYDEYWVVDCGIIICVDRGTNEEYHVGDWIVARGRLDAYLIEG